MIRLIVVTCALALAHFVPVWPGAHAQTATAFDQGLLWRIEKAGVAPSHLFGTIHLADKRVTALPPDVRREFDAAKSFVMEVAPDPSNMAALAARMMYLDGRTLLTVAGEEIFHKLAPLAAQLGLPPEVARQFKPWAMVLLLQMPQQQMEDVLDFRLNRLAAEQGKAIDYLETVDEQVAVFEGMTEQDQLALLRHAVETHHEVKAQTDALVQAYVGRDLASMWRIGEAEVARRPELKPLKAVFDQRLLFDRNPRMVERMQPQLQAGGAFIAVGALHLYGEKGLLRLLEHAGYRVTRVY
jgi:uncharacterized protein YbaP (TraB family)